MNTDKRQILAIKSLLLQLLEIMISNGLRKAIAINFRQFNNSLINVSLQSDRLLKAGMIVNKFHQKNNIDLDEDVYRNC
jgi:hypothetical protein